MAKGLLLAVFDYANAQLDEFNDWYDTEHIPERQAVPGFGACERWLSDEGETISVATYDLDSLAVLRSDDYKAIAYDKLSPWSQRIGRKARLKLRFEGVQAMPGDAAAPAGAGGLLVNAMNVAPEAEADFNAWYDEEHIPALAGVPGTLAARRYVAEGETGGSHRYLAIYHLEHPDVTRGEAWKKAIDTPWSERVRPHFRDRVRILTHRYVRGQ